MSWEFLVALAAVAVAVWAIVNESRQSKEALSLDIFMRALDEFADPESREYRRYIYNNFPDYTREDYLDQLWKSRLKNGVESLKFKIFDGDKTAEETKQVKVLDRDSEKTNEYVISGEISVKIDRIGFMFYNINISPTFKRAYIEWLCVTFCELWNSLAPHIFQRREKRAGVQFVPYFEQIAYLSYPLYKRQRKDVRIIVLNSDLLTEKMNEFRRDWRAPE